MEEKKEKKISLNQAILIIIAILVVIFGIIFFIYYIQSINNIYDKNIVMFSISAIAILMSVIAIVSMLVIKHNRKIANESNTKKPVNKIVFGAVIGVLILIVIFFAIVSAESLMIESMLDLKPIIYLYPKEEKQVSVNLLYDDMITVSYPKYITGWKVLAKKDGTLIDLSTNKSLYSLYYECNNKIDFKVEQDGFIVKGENISEFLEEKLHILGLTEREAEEFIIYWLPKLEANKYNYIRFATLDEINANMPLKISPEPDTTIRVLMTFKGLDNPIEVKEQNLITPERKGFVAVEWGGTEIK